MDALENILNQYRIKGEVDLQRRDLVIFAMNLFKEVEEIEHDNTGAPGKAAIEYLLNQKYMVVENPKLSRITQDILLKEIDSVINKVVVKYHIKRKGKNFYFNEDLTQFIQIPASIDVNDPETVVNKIATAQEELESLKIQLANSDLQSISQTLFLKKAVFDKEIELIELKKLLTKLVPLNLPYSPIVRQHYRALGEAKKEAATGAVIGGTVAGTVASKSFKNKTKFEKKRKDFQQAAKDKEAIHKELAGLRGEARHIKRSVPDGAELSHNKSVKLDKLKKKITQKTQDYKAANSAFNAGAKKVVGLSKEAAKRGMKAGLKGAAVGAGLGLAAAAIHKKLNKNENLSLTERLNTHLERLNSLKEDSDDFRSAVHTGRTMNTLYKGFDNVYREGHLAKFQHQLSTLRRNKGLKVASIVGALLLGAAGLNYIIKKAREKGVERVKNSIRSTQSRARNSKTLTNREKITIQNNGNAAIQKLDQVYKKNNRRK